MMSANNTECSRQETGECQGADLVAVFTEKRLLYCVSWVRLPTNGKEVRRKLANDGDFW